MKMQYSEFQCSVCQHTFLIQRMENVSELTCPVCKDKAYCKEVVEVEIERSDAYIEM